MRVVPLYPPGGVLMKRMPILRRSLGALSLRACLGGCALLTSATCPAPNDPSPFGVNQPPWAAVPPGGYDTARNAGFKWVRIFLDWDYIEPQQGSFVWGVYGDQILNWSTKGFSILAVLHRTPQWKLP